jgi:hypothetical protein
METTITYFEAPGIENTGTTLAIAKQRAQEAGVKRVVIASTTGGTAREASRVFGDTGIRLVVVPHQRDLRDEERFDMEVAADVERQGHRVYWSTMLFSTNDLYGNSAPTALANMLRTGVIGVLVAEAGSGSASSGEPTVRRVFPEALEKGSGMASHASEGSTRRSEELDLAYVPYCGLYCKLCENVARIPKLSSALLKALVGFGWESFGDDDVKHLIATLRGLSGDRSPDLGGCRGGKCGNPDCQIRKCAQQREMVVCSSCRDYPCDRFTHMAKEYPLLLPDGQRQREVGLARWMEEQEERVKAGFCYADVRYTVR